MSSGIIDQTYQVVPIEDLAFLEKNSNQGDIGAVVGSIETNSFYGAVVVQRNTGVIIAGNHRVAAARTAGLTHVPVLYVDVDDEQARRISLADNRTARLGADDDATLAEVLSALAVTDLALAGTGYDGDDLDDLLNRLTPQATPERPIIGWRVQCDVADEAAAEAVCELLAANGHPASRAARK